MFPSLLLSSLLHELSNVASKESSSSLIVLFLRYLFSSTTSDILTLISSTSLSFPTRKYNEVRTSPPTNLGSRIARKQKAVRISAKKNKVRMGFTINRSLYRNETSIEVEGRAG